MNGIRWADWIHAGDTVVDVGANVGDYTQPFAAAVGPTGQVIAFEPDPLTADRCRATVSALPQVEVRTTAVGAQCGTSVFYRTGPPTQHSRWLVNVTKYASELTVPVVTLDCALKGRTIHGLKIDAQGDDGWVLTGATEVLARMPVGAWLVFELWTAGLKVSGFALDDLPRLLDGWTVVAQGKSYSETQASLPAILASVRGWTNGTHTNVLLRKGI
jgi:FkbM family methyltransferase